ncbi:MAG: DMT family transporter [Pseudomonadota bacterium]
MSAEKIRSNRTTSLWAALAVIGLAWGSTQIFSKIIVNAGHHPIGISFVSTAFGAIVLVIILAVLRRPLPFSRPHLIFYAVCGATGTALPHALGYTALQELQVGIVSIVIAIVPLMTLVGSLFFGLERAQPTRLAGLLLGAIAVMLLVIPDTSLPDPDLAIWIALPILTSLSYTIENIYIAKAQPAGLDPMQIMCGLFIAALVMLIPVVAVTDTWMPVGRWDDVELSLVAMTFAHIGAYSGFVWLIGRAGPVFAAQVAYIVTLSGVGLGIIVFGETHSAWVWLSLVLMLAGLAMVQPRERAGA